MRGFFQETSLWLLLIGIVCLCEQERIWQIIFLSIKCCCAVCGFHYHPLFGVTCFVSLLDHALCGWHGTFFGEGCQMIC